MLFKGKIFATFVLLFSYSYRQVFIKLRENIHKIDKITFGRKMSWVNSQFAFYSGKKGFQYNNMVSFRICRDVFYKY